ncbi:hypothetical protein [Armatimonas sp.]|uniref:hypothetical protein n=1 Tax=Armatimonas sp. TaxID=1872638 RepID=UPI00286A4A27|nr:hypothetical protein [Armatimonas sp.]
MFRTTITTTLLALASLPVAAQTPPGDPLPKGQETVSTSPLVVKPRTTERQSQLNPAGKAHGDTTNRGRMSADFLWGITNGNRAYEKAPFARIPNQSDAAPIQPDGYTMPYPVQNVGGLRRRVRTDGQGSVTDLLNPRLLLDDELLLPLIAQVAHPVNGTGPGALGSLGGFFRGTNWASVTAPSPGGGAGYVGTSYSRIAAIERPAGALPDATDPAPATGTPDNQPGGPDDPNKFIWYPRVSGVAGQVTRFAIRVHIPTVDPTGSEARITDARYVVYYVVPLPNGQFLRKRKICFVGQDSAGEAYLLGDDGKPATFPFFSDATYSDPAWLTRTFSNFPALQFGHQLSRARVELDNTTENEITGTQFVVADQIEFSQRVGSVKGSPVVTPPHGGRKVDTTQPLAAGPEPHLDPYDQPAKGPNNYALDILLTPGGLFAFLNDSFNFINNPGDPAYTAMGNPLFGKFDPANPSTLFRGPESLIDPRDVMGNRVGVVDAVNNQQYRNTLGAAIPLFSHMQVLMSRTNYIADPEADVPDSEKDGTRTIEVGSIYSLDWLTGTVIWRFPDKTYLPQLPGGAVWRDPSGSPVAGAGLRNSYDSVNQLNLVPGIGAYDTNGNGVYDDDEIYIVGQGTNPSGAVEAAPTIVPNIAVKGDVQVPAYSEPFSERYLINGVVSAPLFRYAQPDPTDVTGQRRLPIHMPVAFTGAANGVLYAFDPFGNNDSQYWEQTNPASLGFFFPGTTNLLWTFSPSSKSRVVALQPGAPNDLPEPLDKYYLRLKGEIPVPGSFGASSPTVVWAKQDDNLTLDRRVEEPRLFIGNQNKVVYALDPRADAGDDFITMTGVASLPIRKGEQVPHLRNGLPAYLTPGAARADITRHRSAVKWWFETLGPINSTLAVSDVAFARNAGAPVAASRHLFATTGEGRVYSLDWDGPVTKMNHELNMVWNGQDGVGDLGPATPFPTTRPVTGTAAAFNDNVRFHNDFPAKLGARPDLTEGTIRPTWAFPNRYADIDDVNGDVDNKIGTDLPDFSKAYTGNRLATPFTNIAPIYSAPVVMDFAFRDTDNPGIPGLTGIRRYLVVSTNDYDADSPTTPKQGRMFLLDQEGDRNDFLTNPMPSRSSAKFTPSHPAVNSSSPTGATLRPVPQVGTRIYSQALDEFVWKEGPFGKASPAWTYRFVYDTYDAANNPITRLRNRPTPGTPLDPSGLLGTTAGEPARRTLPTIFLGGQGRLFAMDIDEETGLLLRWRGGSAASQPSPIPTDGSITIPVDLSALGDFLNPAELITGNPFSPLFNVGNQNTLNLNRKRVMARTVSLLGDGSAVDGQLVLTAGPLQNRSNTTAMTAAAALPNTRPPLWVNGTDPMVPLLPTLDAPVTKPILTFEPPVILDPMGPIVYNLTPFGFDLDLTVSLPPAAAFPEALFLPIVDLTGRFVNQDISDPITTTRGSWEGVLPPFPADEVNKAFQYPTLLVTTAQGVLHEVSTNIEGEDPSVATNGGIQDAGTVGNQFGPLGWALTEGDDLNRYNPHGHVIMFTQEGPGGAGTGISVVTNAYFPSLDSGYARRQDRLTKQILPTPDPTGKYTHYPQGEPQSLAATAGYNSLDNPRAGLLPRPLYQGNGANGAATPAVAAVDPDWHTGQTGFPLDMNGLFYDRRFANGNATNHNADGRLRLPAYDQQGTRSATPPVAGSTGIPETNLERGTNVTAMTADKNDNPAGQNVTWVFVGGQDGIFYAYTPVFRPDLGGITSGGLGGTGYGTGFSASGNSTDPKVDTFDEATYLTLRNAARAGSPIRPDRDGRNATWVNPSENTPPFPMGQGAGRIVTNAAARSIASQGGKNLYEWGEKVYIVAWDITVLPSEVPTPPMGTLSPIPTAFTATLTITPRNGGTPITRNVTLERDNTTGAVAVYPYVARYNTPAQDTPSGSRPAQLGLACYEFTLDTNAGLPLTPGTQFEISVTQPAARRLNLLGVQVGAIRRYFPTNAGIEAERRTTLSPIVAVANPLAVQGFLTNTMNNAPVLAQKAAGDPFAGGIGPFRTPSSAVSDYTNPASVRNRVANNNPTPGTMDPDRGGFEYSQALSNGNTITRYDYTRYNAGPMGVLQLNPNFGRRLRTNGADDPSYYIPVATSTGYIGHGRTGSTDLSATQRNLRVVNRAGGSLNLTSVRAEVRDDLIWRWWPGLIPNADTDPTDNPSITPVGMRPDGRINPLPWETAVPQAQPWKRRADTGASGSVLGLGNVSPDYPDIIAGSRAQQGRQAVSVIMAGADAVQGTVSLPNGQLNNPVNGVAATNPLQTNPLFATTVNVRIPQYQPANLVAMHSLTAAYEAPSTSDGAQPFVGEGKTQLPRGTGTNASTRDLRQYNPGSGVFNGPFAITPYGYTSRIRVYVDNGSGTPGNSNNGRWDNGEPYREVEVWSGVPVDMGLKSNETPVDLGALSAGFGIQNGLMGYQRTGAADPGFLPDPIGRFAPGVAAPYDKFFKKMTIQNIGNVNLYNLRAAQAVESLTDVDVTGVGFRSYFGMTSETVDARYGLLAFAADPTLANNGIFTPTNVMPQVVTSLDRQFDAVWQGYLSTSVPWLQQLVDDGTGTGGTTTVFNRYYAGLMGRHTLHKPTVGSSTPSVLSLPDVPTITALVPAISALQPESSLPALGVAVPVGTPVGVYRSQTTASPIAPPSLAVFEDHDTIHPDATPASAGLTGYMGIPTLTGQLSASGRVTAAGPLYGGQNALPPGMVSNTILPLGAEGVLRARNFAVAGGQMAGVEFQPHTSPAIDLKVTVTETPLTGQIADFAGIGYDGIFSGLLNGIDTMPLMDPPLTNPAFPKRPASVVTPAAFRGANGRLNLYFARNADGTGVAQTAAGISPFRLFHSHMNWDETLGAFQASAPGSPVSNPTTNTARWFTPTVMIGAGAAGESNMYPSVLQTTSTTPEATLFWVNSVATAGALPTDTIFWTGLDANGNPNDNGRSLLSLINPNSRPDPTIRRYGPRAAFDPQTRNGFVTFYGGAPGKQGLYYIPYRGTNTGVPTSAGSGRGSGELALPVPPGIVTASEPSPTMRRLNITDHSVGAFSGTEFIPTVDAGSTPVVDVVYTGVLRNIQTPDLFMGRYKMVSTPRGNQLILTALPQVDGEQLVQAGRDLAWRSKHIAWYVRYNSANNVVDNLAVRVLQANGMVRYQTQPNAWQYDSNSKIWVQTIRRTSGVLYVYADTETGEVRFRGADEPQSNDKVVVDYQPTTYRLTPDTAADAGAFVTTDNRLLPNVPSSQVYRRLLNGTPALIPSSETDPRFSGLGRQWIAWSKGAQPNRPARLYYSARRVGVDLRTTVLPIANRLARDESVALLPRDGAGNQTPRVSGVVVSNNATLAGATSVPYEVDFSTGRVYVDPLYEGMYVGINYVASRGAATRNVQVVTKLGYIEELSATDTYSMGLQVPMQQTINEGQVSAFVDLYNYDPSRPDLLKLIPGRGVGSPGYQQDPTLQPGKLWMFWTSSRPRNGQVPVGGNLLSVPSGFELFYQTIAPRFEFPSFSPGQ